MFIGCKGLGLKELVFRTYTQRPWQAELVDDRHGLACGLVS